MFSGLIISTAIRIVKHLIIITAPYSRNDSEAWSQLIGRSVFAQQFEKGRRPLSRRPLSLSTESIFEIASQRLTGYADRVQNGRNRCRKINEDGKPKIAVADDAEEDQNCLDNESK